MAKAIKCPVCEGKGKIPDPLTMSATATIEVVCHGCGGKGWVEVSE